MSDMPRSSAEQLDDDKFDNPGGEEDIASVDYPPDEPLGVDDPSILGDGSIAEDDMATRVLREEPEVQPDLAPVSETELDNALDEVLVESLDTPLADEEVGIDLLDPSEDPDLLDDTPELFATQGDEGDMPAEVAAIHIVDDA